VKSEIVRIQSRLKLPKGIDLSFKVSYFVTRLYSLLLHITYVNKRQNYEYDKTS